jgi:phage terminase large subunit
MIFFQEIGEEIRIVDHYANNNEGLAHYAQVLADKAYRYGRHYLPHDAAVRDLSTGISREQFMWDLGIRNTMVAPKASVQDGIEKVRQIFHRCRFNESKTQALMDSLQNYKKDKSKSTGEAMNTPRHDQYSHDADAFRVLATAIGTYGVGGLDGREVNIQSFTF